MIESLSDLPDNAVGFKASGKVTKQDYEEVVVPAVESLIASTGKVNFLLVLDTDLRNYTLGADYKDILIGLKYFTHWRKIAVVTDQDFVRKYIVGVNYPLPGETRAFSLNELEEAKSWVTS